MNKSINRNRDFDIFTMLAFDILRGSSPDGKRYPAMHTVWSGYNKAAREHFKGIDVVAETKSMAEQGLIQLSLAKGGALLRPMASLLFPLNKKQQVLAASHRIFLETFKQGQDAERECRQQVRISAEAVKCLSEGNFSEALRNLGY